MNQTSRFQQLLKRLGNPVFTSIGIGIDISLVGVLYIFHFELPLTPAAITVMATYGLFVGILCGGIQFLGRKMFSPAPWLVEGLMSIALAGLALAFCSHIADPMTLWATTMIAVPVFAALGYFLLAPAVVAFSDWVDRKIYG